LDKIETPVVIINFKTYTRATGEKAVLLAQTCERVSNKYEVPIVVAPQILDLFRVAKAVEIPVFSQHMDPGEPGRFTGHVLGDTLVESGCIGTLLNHSERRMQLADIEHDEGAEIHDAKSGGEQQGKDAFIRGFIASLRRNATIEKNTKILAMYSTH